MVPQWQSPFLSSSAVIIMGCRYGRIYFIIPGWIEKVIRGRLVDDIGLGVKVLDELVNIKVIRGEMLLLHCPLQCGVESIFDRVVCSARQKVGNGTPFVS